MCDVGDVPIDVARVQWFKFKTGIKLLNKCDVCIMRAFLLVSTKINTSRFFFLEMRCVLLVLIYVTIFVCNTPFGSISIECKAFPCLIKSRYLAIP